MSGPVQQTTLERAREAASAGEWQEAHALLAEADTTAPLDIAGLTLLADVAYAAGHLDTTIDAWERAYALGLRGGDDLGAAGAAVRVAMHLLFDTALLAPVRGWATRAERLLKGHADTPMHAWLAVVRNYERLLSGDFANAREWARRAIAIGTQCEPAAAALGRVAEARSLILEGEVDAGLALLNEAGVASVSGELDPLITGIVYCELVCGLQALAQYDLAEQWTEAMERWRPGHAIGSAHGRCRVHRAEILRLRGAHVEAEQEALQACDELRPYLRRELGWPLTELGRIRLRRGDLDGAEAALLAANQAGWDPQPGLALVYLARGDVARAAACIREALDHPPSIPSKELPPHTALRRAPLLEAQVEIAIAAGDRDAARAAAIELSGIADAFGSQALEAGAALAHGRVALAMDDATGAHHHFENAAQLWTEVGAPYEIALARMGLAHALRTEGHEERALLELDGARSTFERIGAERQAAIAGGATSATGEARSMGGMGGSRYEQQQPTAVDAQQAFVREGDYWSLTFDGRTVRMRDLIGLRHLARLLATPGHERHVLDLVADERGTADAPQSHSDDGLSIASGDDAGELLDAQAKATYRRRLTEIEEDIAEAEELGDAERAAQAEAERHWLARELARAVGLGGRDRRAGAASERARASVTRAIRQTMARIRDAHPALGEHLERTIRTGTFCVYLPDPRVPTRWRL